MEDGLGSFFEFKETVQQHPKINLAMHIRFVQSLYVAIGYIQTLGAYEIINQNRIKDCIFLVNITQLEIKTTKFEIFEIGT